MSAEPTVSRRFSRSSVENLGVAPRRAERLARFHERVLAVRRSLRISDTTWLLLLAALAGLLAGLGSIAFHYLISVFQYLAFGTANHAGMLDAVTRAEGYPWWRIVIAPAVGGLVVGPLIYFFAREAKGHGVPAVIRAVHERGGRISPIIALVKTVASAITLGSGGSLGREGPVVQIGASLGSAVGQFLGVTPRQMKMLAAGGAAAGLAAIFNAPLGGAFFSLEVIVGSFAMEAFGPVVVASVAATVVSRGILGDHPVITAAEYRLEHTYELLVYVFLGLVSGSTAVLFTRGIALGAAAFEKVPLPDWAKPCIGGGLVGLMAVTITPRILGNGYETVDALMTGRPIETFLLFLLVVKLAATCVTLGSGGSGGVFGPTLFMGAVLGAVVGHGAAWLHIPVAPAPAYSLVGMAAFVAGATHAPVSMVLMLFEMSDNYQIVLPLLISSSIASLIAHRIYHESVDTVLDARQGRRITKNLEEMTLHAVSVGEAASIGTDAAVAVGAPLRDVLARFLAAKTEIVGVIDKEGRYRGAIPARGLAEATEEIEDTGKTLIALDIMRTDLPVLAPEEPLTRAIDLFHGVDVDSIPVVARDGGRFVGFLSEGDIVSAYRRALLRTELVTTVMDAAGESAPSRLEFPAEADVVTVELPVPAWLAGKTLAETKLRSTYGVNVLGVKAENAVRLPDPAVALTDKERLVVIGPRSAIEAMRSAV
jgi:CIC family chloride channel protein